MTNAEARCNKSLRPRKPEGSLGRTAQDVHLDSHTAPELWRERSNSKPLILKDSCVRSIWTYLTASPERERWRERERDVSHFLVKMPHYVFQVIYNQLKSLSNEAGAGQFMTDFLPLTAWSQMPPVSLSVSLCA